MKLHPWNFWNLCYTPWKFQGLYPRLVKILHDFFLDHPCKFLFLAPGIFTFYLEIPCPPPPHSPPVWFFFLKLLIHAVTLTVVFPVSDEWLIFRCRNFILCQKKIFWRRKQHSTLYCELAPLTFGVTCLKL